MKKLNLVVLLFLSASIGFSQKTEGIITYKRTVDLHRNIRDEAMKAQVPPTRTDYYSLAFTPAEAKYERLPDLEESTESSGGFRGGGMMGGNTEIYTNLATKKTLELRQMRNESFLITDSLRFPIRWVLSSETKIIQGFQCKKATAVMDTVRKVSVEVWFAPEIKCSLGPDRFIGLDGLVLTANSNNGAIVFEATEFKWKKPKPTDLRQPKDGTPITNEEFRKKMEELRKQRGDAPRMRRD